MLCSSCGFQLAADDVFCLSCGTDISHSASINRDAPVLPTVQRRTDLSPRCYCGALAAEVGTDGVCTRCGAMSSPRDDLIVELKEGLALRTHAGRRHWPNEDYGIVDFEILDSICYRWLVVSDGVSSSENADLASEVACRAVSDSLRAAVRNKTPPIEAVNLSIMAAQKSVLAIPFDRSKARGRKIEPPEATLAVVLLNADTATLGWLGDSRIYSIVRGHQGLFANLLTRDHSYANAMVDMGRMTFEEAMQTAECHAITQSLGAVPEGEALEPGLKQVPVQGAIYFLACSDGLWNYVHPVHHEPASVLVHIVSTTPESPKALVSTLVDHANECGGHDNITVAVAMLQGANNE